MTGAPHSEAGGELKAQWRLVLGAMLGMAVGVTGVIPYVSGLFLPHLMGSFGWSRSGVSFGQTLQSIGSAVVVPICGLLVDRIGTRWPILIGMSGFALCLALLGFSDADALRFWALMFAIGSFGALAGPLIFTRIVASRFDRRRGLAIGLTLSGVGVGAAVYPLLIGSVIDRLGWRGGYFVLAGIVVAALPLVLLLTSTANRSRATTDRIESPTPDQQVSPRPWLVLHLAVAFFLASIAVTGFLLHMMPMLAGWGLSHGTAALAQSLLGAAMLVSRLASGAIADRVPAERLAAACMGLGALGALAFLVGGASLAIPAAIFLGIALGSEVDLIGYLVARHFPLARYGRAYGWVYAAALIGAGSSPVAMAYLIDADASHRTVLVASALCFAASALLLLRLPGLGARDRHSADAARSQTSVAVFSPPTRGL